MSAFGQAQRSRAHPARHHSSTASIRHSSQRQCSLLAGLKGGSQTKVVGLLEQLVAARFAVSQGTFVHAALLRRRGVSIVRHGQDRATNHHEDAHADRCRITPLLDKVRQHQRGQWTDALDDLID